ncbi:MAG: S8 family serine peptidase, partial [Halioglobus sp.]|nr:S8 family serine peptidase [Halioglobus sp.]
MRIRQYMRAMMLLLALALTACGGGGGGGGGNDTNDPDPPAPQPPPQVENFQLTGTITASDSQAVDSDTNDPTRVVLPNDTVATAQPIGNPVTLGGYINEAGMGPAGRSRGPGDFDDYFIVELLAGQRITMLVADFEEADADLYLYDAAGTLLDFSLDTDDVETIVVPADGTYVIRAAIFFNATNYILAIGAPSAATAVPTQHDIVPFEAIVTYADTLQASSANSSRSALEQRMGLTQRAGGPGRNRRMVMARTGPATLTASARLGRMASIRSEITDPALRDRWETLQTIKTLRRDPGVRYAEPNYRVRALATPNDEAFPVQWHYPLIGLPDAWDTTTGDPNVIVAVIDTGILAGHPDLAGQLVTGFDFVSNPTSAGDGNGIDANPEDPGDSTSAGSEAYHGTHVLGTVAARGNNQIGVVGAAFTSRAMPLRALGVDGGGTTYDVEQAVRYAAGLPNDSNTVPPQAADIINLSLGGG